MLKLLKSGQQAAVEATERIMEDHSNEADMRKQKDDDGEIGNNDDNNNDHDNGHHDHDVLFVSSPLCFFLRAVAVGTGTGNKM